MAIDEGLAQRIREALGSEPTTEKKMFGGLAFLSHGHMFVPPGFESDEDLAYWVQAGHSFVATLPAK